ncbi:unnamed protein product [Diatraea saccharalis]|uniref:Uncharacterized protein n=1 Tax=Diatraea saccharalis TaxID=40085 RepID=A0A9N9QYW4_9NEOP|nr:unnamed protein product [Diatraea saccharalis]
MVEAAICARHSEPSQSTLQLPIRADRAFSLASPVVGRRAKSQRGQAVRELHVVISEILAFIRNKLDIIDTESLIRIYVSAFSEEDIECAKKLLFSSVKTKIKFVSRRKQQKEKDLEDILTVLKTAEPDQIPIFVAYNLQKLPPICFDHFDVTKLLKDTILLREDKNGLIGLSHVSESADDATAVSPPSVSEIDALTHGDNATMVVNNALKYRTLCPSVGAAYSSVLLADFNSTLLEISIDNASVKDSLVKLPNMNKNYSNENEK